MSHNRTFGLVHSALGLAMRETPQIHAHSRSAAAHQPGHHTEAMFQTVPG